MQYVEFKPHDKYKGTESKLHLLTFEIAQEIASRSKTIGEAWDKVGEQEGIICDAIWAAGSFDQLIECENEGEEKQNTQWLKGLCCPKCKSLGPLSIAGTAIFRWCHDDGIGDAEDVEWLDDGECECDACKHTAKVKDFKTSQ